MTAPVRRGGAVEPEKRWVAEIEGWRPFAKHFGVNARQHWRVTAAQVKRAHWKTEFALSCAQWPREISSPAVVTITICQSKGKQPDSDALVILPKAVRDTVAKYLGVDDGPTGPITWHYDWQRGSDGVVMVLEVEG